MPQLICTGLSLGYEGKTVVNDINFKVSKGDYLCIVGENGSGKTTLMKALLHLRQPLCGTIETGDGLRADEIGYLPQQTEIQKDFPASVREIVLSGCLPLCKNKFFYGKKERQIAAENMEKLGISHLAGRCYRDLSGGQQQRALLARALCATSKMLLLDEPVAGLDPKATAEMYQVIADLNKSGTTIVMVSHDIAAAVKNASHILHIGSPSFFGTTRDYIHSDVGRIFHGICKEEGCSNG